MISAPVKANLLADLSDYQIAIDTGFTGAQVLLYGTSDGTGDVVVIIRGPERPLKVWRKKKILGVWVNYDMATFDQAPSYYMVACNKDLASCADPNVRLRHQIGTPYLYINLAKDSWLTEAEADVFRKAFIDYMQNKNLYSDDKQTITFFGQQLFRTKLSFPAHVPVGTYSVEVFQINENNQIGAQTLPLTIKKVGIEAKIYTFAHEYPYAFGLLSILMALMIGWVGNLIFIRKQ